MDEKPVTPDDKRWARLQKLRATMGTSAIGELISVFSPAHKHVVEETRSQRDRRSTLATPDDPDKGFEGTVTLEVPRRED